MRDNSDTGYIQVNLSRGPINTTDPSTPIQSIASASTSPQQARSNFVEVSGMVDRSRATVDNQRYGYFFRVDFLGAPAVSGTDVALQLRGCSVAYR